MLIAIIAKQDWLMIRGWVRTRALTKLIVMLGFVGVIAGISAGLYTISKYYFNLLASYGVYGQAVATYSIGAGLVILFWLSLLTSTLAAYPMLYFDNQLRQWLTLPLETISIFRANFGKLILASGWAVVVLLWPVLRAYGSSPLAHGEVMLRGILVMGILILMSQSLGAWLSLWAGKTFGRLSQGSLILWLMSLVILLYALGRFLFPPSFFTLSEAPDWQNFASRLGSLPLVTHYLPTAWLASTITAGFSRYTLLAVLLAGICWWLTDRYARRHYLVTWYKAQEHPLLAGKRAGITIRRHFPEMGSNEMTVVAKDWLSISRNTSELIYFLFIMGLGIAFYLVVRTIPLSPHFDPTWLRLIHLSAYAGFEYLVIVVAGRFMYPLMAKEAKALWLVFAAPISRTTLLWAKLSLATFFLIPWFLLALMTASALNLTESLMWAYGLFLVYGAVAIAVIHLTMGVIAPNFPEGERPDAASTSASGMIALAMSLAVTALGTQAWQAVVNGNYRIIWWYSLGLCVVMGILLFVAHTSMRWYEKV